MIRSLRFEWIFITFLVVLIAFESSAVASNTDISIGLIAVESVETQEAEGEVYLPVAKSVVVNTPKFPPYHPGIPSRPWAKTPPPYHAHAPPLA